MFSGLTSGSTSRKNASRSGPVIGVKPSATAKSASSYANVEQPTITVVRGSARE
jgi:hypothetical protein